MIEPQDIQVFFANIICFTMANADINVFVQTFVLLATLAFMVYRTANEIKKFYRKKDDKK